MAQQAHQPSHSFGPPRRGYKRLWGGVVAGIVCLAVVSIYVDARRQKHVVAQIEALNGLVVYECDAGNDVVGQPPQTKGDGWPVRVFGRDFFYSVESVELRGDKITDASMPHLNDLRGLRAIDLEHTAISGKSMPFIACKNLEFLAINGGNIADRDLEFLGHLPDLGQLYLRNLPVTDSMLSALYRLRKLRGVDLLDTRVTLQGVTELHRATGAAVQWDGGLFPEAGTGPRADLEGAKR